MPTYEYLCKDCGHKFSKTMTIKEHEQHSMPCPKCKSKKVGQLLTSFFAKTSSKT